MSAMSEPFSPVGNVISPEGLRVAPGRAVTTSASLADGVTEGSNRSRQRRPRRVTDITPALRAATRTRCAWARVSTCGGAGP